MAEGGPLPHRPWPALPFSSRGGRGAMGRWRQVAMEGESLPPPCLPSFLSRRLASGLASALPTLDCCRGPVAALSPRGLRARVLYVMIFTYADAKEKVRNPNG
ncbi:unnamed protein product [Coccothraustes coccothraustes]